MKDLKYYMSLPYKIEIEEDAEAGGYTASIPELPGCLTYGETAEEALEHMDDAKREWILSALEESYPIPEPHEPSYSGQFKLRLSKSLHKALAERAKEEGTSLNQYCVYLLSERNALRR